MVHLLFRPSATGTGIISHAHRPSEGYHELLAAEQVFRSQGYDSWSQETVELAEACRR